MSLNKFNTLSFMDQQAKIFLVHGHFISYFDMQRLPNQEFVARLT